MDLVEPVDPGGGGGLVVANLADDHGCSEQRCQTGGAPGGKTRPAGDDEQSGNRDRVESPAQLDERTGSDHQRSGRYHDAPRRIAFADRLPAGRILGRNRIEPPTPHNGDQAHQHS